MKCEVAYFFDYDRNTLGNLAKVMQQKVFDRNEIIFKTGEPSVHMFIILFGEVGLYSDELSEKPLSVVTDNQTFGEKALDSLETRDRTAVAHKVTVCLTLDKHEFEEKVFFL